MIKGKTLYSFIAVVAIISAIAGVAAGQKQAAPRQEKLLNGLKVLVWNTPGAETVSLKLRIHSGSAFDPQEREGVMKLLSRSFFPTEESQAFFRDELGGSINVVCNYDYIQIEATGRNTDFLTLLETVAQAVANPDLSKESTAALKTALLDEVREIEKDGAYVADRTIAKRLFGTFPYGRPVLGTAESVQKIDFADLRFARERLLTADNGTLAITGNVDPSLAVRAVRRYFGAWLKADKKIPSTFRQPDAPDAAIIKVEMPGLSNSEVRFAVRGFARSSKEFAAAEILTRTLQVRFSELVAKNSGTAAAVAHDEHVLPGAFVFRYRSQPSAPAVLPIGGGTDTAASLRSILSRPVTESEFSAAKSEVMASIERRNAADMWIDVDTFKLASIADDAKAFQNVTLADVNSLSSRLGREPLAAAVVAAAPSAAANTAN